MTHQKKTRPASSKKRAKENKGIPGALSVAAGILLVLFAGAAIAFGPVVWKRADTPPEGVAIRVPRNADNNRVTDSVAKYLGRSYASAVAKALLLQNADMSSRHGAYRIDHGMSPLRAARRLAHGAQTPLRLTVNGFRTLPLLAQRISARMDFSPEDFIAAASSPETLAKHGLAPGQELALFPDDTYEVYWSASPDEVIEKMASNFDRIWQNDSRTEKARNLGLSPAQAVIIASIADEETNKAAEKGLVGRLYLNRLKKGMPLQADPTVKYAVGDFSLRRILKKHLSVDSPYNTYRNRGLPPGPIRTVGVASIDALLNSSPSDDLFMCAREDFSGYHNFASTLAEHNRNAARYQKKLNERGIR